MIAVVAIVAVQLLLALVLFGTTSLDRRIGEARARSLLASAPVPVVDPSRSRRG